jgi:hypothetical protein
MLAIVYYDAENGLNETLVFCKLGLGFGLGIKLQ